MRAAILNDFESPPQPGDFDEPAAQDGASVVEVSVAGLNPVDLFIASGGMPDSKPAPAHPSVAGREGIGLIDGRRVYFDRSVAPFGSMAERTLVEQDNLIDVPDGVEDELAVCFGIAGLAAWLGLKWRGQIENGETVLVLGASGVVGQIAVQAARLLGAGRVVAAARSEDGLARARDDLGADAVVKLDAHEDLTAAFRDAAGGDIQLVLDPIWGAPAVAALQALAPWGRLVQIGNSSGPEATIPARAVRGIPRSILGHTNFAAPREVKEKAFQTMCGLAASGDLRVPTETVKLDDVAEAWRRQAESPRHKLLIKPG